MQIKSADLVILAVCVCISRVYLSEETHAVKTVFGMTVSRYTYEGRICAVGNYRAADSGVLGIRKQTPFVLFADVDISYLVLIVQNALVTNCHNTLGVFGGVEDIIGLVCVLEILDLALDLFSYPRAYHPADGKGNEYESAPQQAGIENDRRLQEYSANGIEYCGAYRGHDICSGVFNNDSAYDLHNAGNYRESAHRYAYALLYLFVFFLHYLPFVLLAKNVFGALLSDSVRGQSNALSRYIVIVVIFPYGDAVLAVILLDGRFDLLYHFFKLISILIVSEVSDSRKYTAGKRQLRLVLSHSLNNRIEQLYIHLVRGLPAERNEPVAEHRIIIKGILVQSFKCCDISSVGILKLQLVHLFNSFLCAVYAVLVLKDIVVPLQTGVCIFIHRREILQTGEKLFCCIVVLLVESFLIICGKTVFKILPQRAFWEHLRPV